MSTFQTGSNDLALRDASGYGQHYERNIAKGRSKNHYGNNYTNAHHHHYYNNQDVYPSRPDDSLRTLRDRFLKALSYHQMGDRLAKVRTDHADTCQWVFKTPEFTRWQDPTKHSEHNGFFWMRGKPGAGKSTIMKSAVRKAMEEDDLGQTILSFFFNNNGGPLEKSTEGMYRCLLHDMVQDLPLQDLAPIFKKAKLKDKDFAVYEKDGWSVTILEDLFSEVVYELAFVRHGVCYIDALDEGSNEHDVRDMIRFLANLAKTAPKKKLRFSVCLSSRHHPMISGCSSEELILDEHKDHKKAITRYIERELNISNPSLKYNIATEIGEKAASVFLWVVLVVYGLNLGSDRGDWHELSCKLQEVPESIQDLCKEIVGKEPDRNGRLMASIQWVLYSTRPLACEELYSAIMASTGTPTPDCPRLDSTPKESGYSFMQKTILSSSRGLVELSIVDEPHDFDDWEMIMDEPAKSSDWEMIMMDEPARFDVDKMVMNEQAKFNAEAFIMNESPFLSDKETFMANPSNVSDRKMTMNETAGLYDKEAENREIARFIHESVKDYFLEGGLRDLDSSLPNDTKAVSHERLAHRCYSYFELASRLLGEQALETNAPVDEYDQINSICRSWPLLQYAVGNMMKHAEAAIESGLRLRIHISEPQMGTWLLIQERIREKRETCYPIRSMCTMLHVLCNEGHTGMVNAELERLADIPEAESLAYMNTPCRGQLPILGTALHIATYAGHLDIARALMGNGADVNAPCDFYGTPLFLAIQKGHSDIAEELLAHGAEANLWKDSDGTALHLAIDKLNLTLVRSLLRHGANIDAQRDWRKSPLFNAVRTKSEPIIKMLLEYGADVHVRDISKGLNAVQFARKIAPQVLSVFSDCGINVNGEEFVKRSSWTVTRENSVQM
ncbi:hypothetical protein Q7P37_006918 [Cladosporium fusiforme]